MTVQAPHLAGTIMAGHDHGWGQEEKGDRNFEHSFQSVKAPIFVSSSAMAFLRSR